MWHQYTFGKQTYLQLSEQFQCSVRTIQRKIKEAELTKREVIPRKVIIVMDTTYFGRNFGVMVFQDAKNKHVLHKMYVKNETKELYKKGLEYLINQGFIIEGIVCDGKKGLFTLYPNIPVQMCLFHQKAIIRRYLTKRPKLLASIELKIVVELLCVTDKDSFTGALLEWSDKWKTFLKERTKDPETGKSRYVHRSLRSAITSLITNLPWLFTYYDYIHLQIPTTSNSLEGLFSDLKNKLRNHNGLSKENKIRFIDEFFKV